MFYYYVSYRMIQIKNNIQKKFSLEKPTINIINIIASVIVKEVYNREI